MYDNFKLIIHTAKCAQLIIKYGSTDILFDVSWKCDSCTLRQDNNSSTSLMLSGGGSQVKSDRFLGKEGTPAKHTHSILSAVSRFFLENSDTSSEYLFHMLTLLQNYYTMPQILS